MKSAGTPQFREWPRRALALHAAAAYLFLYAPILVLIAFSFNTGRQAMIWRGFSGRWYSVLWNDRAMREAAMTSLVVALSATLIATPIGTMAALGITRYKFRGRGTTRGLLYLPIVIPEIILGVSLLTLFGVTGMRLGMTSVILAHVVFSISYVAVVVKARLAGMDRSVEEAAMDLGAGPLATVFRVTLPLIAPGIIAAALLVFTISLDDYVVTSLVSGVESTTLPVRIYSMLRTSVTPEVNAACTVLLGLTIILIVIAQRLLARR